MLVGIEGSVNLGFILRLAMNYDVDEIVLVSPKASDFDEAARFAARASGLLRELRILENLEEAFEENELRVCTTAKKGSSKDILRQTIPSYSLPEAVRGWEKIALVFGRESTGLTRKELAMCDVLVNIPSSPRYPSLNLSHAVAIMLYTLYVGFREGEGGRVSDRSRIEELVETYRRIAMMLMRGEERIDRASTAFKKILFKSQPTPSEVRLIHFLLRRIERRLRSCSS